MKSIDIFPIKIVKSQVENHSKIKDFLLKNVEDDYKNKGVNDLNSNTYTDYIPGATKVFWPFLYKLYRPTIISMLEHLDIIKGGRYFDLKMRGWYNFTNHTTSKFLHDHTGGPTTINFSCVHYVNVESKMPGTVFQNPNVKMIKSTTPTKNFSVMSDYFNNYWYTPEVSEGDIIMFPSWLDHFIPPHTDGSLRVTTALNIMLRLDQDEGM
jgi:hypothetical protein